jgi:hypothetical protein
MDSSGIAALVRLWKRCPHRDCTLHIEALAGASTRELVGRLGHASPAAALRYQHATTERDQLIAARIEALIAGQEPLPRLRSECFADLMCHGGVTATGLSRSTSDDDHG